MRKIKANHNYLFKIISTAVVCLFLVNNFAFAADVFDQSSPQNVKLSPELMLAGDEVSVPFCTSLICSAVEKRAKTREGELNVIDLRNWVIAGATEEGLKNVAFLKCGNEVHIIVEGKFLIRYYDPENASLGFLFSKGESTSLVSDVEVTSSLRRQIYKLDTDIPPAYSPEEIFAHIIEKAGLNGIVKTKTGTFPTTEKQYRICELQPDGTLVLHPEFLVDYDDVKKAGIGFDYTFEDGKSRWLDLADSIVYRVAMHEFKLAGREGHGHGYIDEGGDFNILHDRERTNIVGRRYSVVDDAMWLWFLHSYKWGDKFRYDDNAFRQHLRDIFVSRKEWAKKARAEFPSLVKDRQKRKEAIGLALMINNMFFAQRKEAGIDTTPAYEKTPMPEYPEEEEGQEGAARATEGDEREEIPEDEVEIPQVRYKQKPERELDERFAEQRASIEMQKDIAMLLGTIEVINADSRNAKQDAEKAEIRERENAFLVRLRDLYKNMQVNIHEDRTYNFYSKKLKELKDRRLSLYRRIEKADDESDKNALERLNREVIRNNRIIIKLQLLIAGMLVRGKSRRTNNKFKRNRNAAIWTLRGALNSAKTLEEELFYRIQRLRGSKRVRQIETTDWMGELIRTFRLDGFDVKVEDAESEEEESKVTVRQQKWINVHTTLVQIRRDFKRGDINEALEKIDMLIKLYSVRYIVVMERYRNIADDLKELRGIIAGCPDANAPPKEKKQEVSRKIDDLGKNIQHPKQRIWVDIPYKNLEKSFHGKLKIIAGYIPEYNLILQNKTNMEYYAEKLAEAAQRGLLSKRNKAMILRGLDRLHRWTERGFVYPKQFAAIDLKPAIELVDRDDHKAAAKYLKSATKQLDARMTEIDRISGHIRKHAAGIYSEFRDADISKRLDDVIEFLGRRDFEQALSAASEIRQLYFEQELIEPGLIRADHNLRRINGMIRSASRARNSEVAITNIKKFADILKGDIEHKGSFRVAVQMEDGTSRSVFLVPGTTVNGLLRMLRKNPSRTWVSIGRGWIRREQFSLKLKDETDVRLSKPARATDGEEYRGESDEIEGGLALAMPPKEDKADEFEALNEQVERGLERMRVGLQLAKRMLTEAQADLALQRMGEVRFGKLEPIREEIKRFLREKIRGDLPLPKIYFVPHQKIDIRLKKGKQGQFALPLWEANGRFTAAHFSKEENSIYLNLNFINFIQECLPDDEEQRDAILAVALHETLRLRGGTHEYAEAKADEISPELRTIYYRAVFLQKESERFDVLNRKRDLSNSGWTWEQVKRVPDAMHRLANPENGDEPLVINAATIESSSGAIQNRITSVMKEVTGRVVTGIATYCRYRPNSFKISRTNWDDVIRAAGSLLGEVRGHFGKRGPDKGPRKRRDHTGETVEAPDEAMSEGSEKAAVESEAKPKGTDTPGVVTGKQTPETSLAGTEQTSETAEKEKGIKANGHKKGASGKNGKNGHVKRKRRKKKNVQLKGLIFEELVWRMYNSAFGNGHGKEVIFEQHFLVSRFLQENRYPDIYIPDFIIADAKWGLAGQNILDTVLKYTRLRLMCGINTPLRIIVFDESEKSRVKGALREAMTQVKEIVKEEQGVDGDDDDSEDHVDDRIKYAIWSWKDFTGRILRQGRGWDVATEARITLKNVTELLGMEEAELRAEKPNDKLLKEIHEEMRRIHSKLKRERFQGARPKDKTIGTPLREAKKWQKELIKAINKETADEIIEELEKIKKYHSPHWQRSYHARVRAFVSFLLSKRGGRRVVERLKIAPGKRVKIRGLLIDIMNNYGGSRDEDVWKKIVDYYKYLKDRNGKDHKYPGEPGDPVSAEEAADASAEEENPEIAPLAEGETSGHDKSKLHVGGGSRRDYVIDYAERERKLKGADIVRKAREEEAVRREEEAPQADATEKPSKPTTVETPAEEPQEKTEKKGTHAAVAAKPEAVEKPAEQPTPEQAEEPEEEEIVMIKPFPKLFDESEFPDHDVKAERAKVGEPVSFDPEMGRYEQEQPGFFRTLDDKALKTASTALNRIGLGCLLEKNIAYSRVRADKQQEKEWWRDVQAFQAHRVRLSRHPDAGHFRYTYEFILPDFEKEPLGDEMTGRLHATIMQHIATAIFLAIRTKLTCNNLRAWAIEKEAFILAEKRNVKFTGADSDQEEALHGYFYAQFVEYVAQKASGEGSLSKEEIRFFDSVVEFLQSEYEIYGDALYFPERHKEYLSPAEQKASIREMQTNARKVIEDFFDSASSDDMKMVLFETGHFQKKRVHQILPRIIRTREAATFKNNLTGLKNAAGFNKEDLDRIVFALARKGYFDPKPKAAQADEPVVTAESTQTLPEFEFKRLGTLEDFDHAATDKLNGKRMQSERAERGYARHIKDGIVGGVTNIMNESGFGFLLDKDIFYTRRVSEASPKWDVTDVKSMIRPYKGGVVGEIMLYDIPRERISRNSRAHQYMPVLGWDPGSYFSAIRSVFPGAYEKKVPLEKVRHILERGKEALKSRVGQRITEEFAKKNKEAFVRQDFLSEIGSTIFASLCAEAFSGNDKATELVMKFIWMQRMKAYTNDAQSLIYLRRMSFAIMETTKYNPQVAFYGGIFGDLFSIYADPEAAILLLGENLTYEERALIEEIREYLEKRYLEHDKVFLSATDKMEEKSRVLEGYFNPPAEIAFYPLGGPVVDFLNNTNEGGVIAVITRAAKDVDPGMSEENRKELMLKVMNEKQKGIFVDEDDLMKRTGMPEALIERIQQRLEDLFSVEIEEGVIDHLNIPYNIGQLSEFFTMASPEEIDKVLREVDKFKYYKRREAVMKQISEQAEIKDDEDLVAKIEYIRVSDLESLWRVATTAGNCILRGGSPDIADIVVDTERRILQTKSYAMDDTDADGTLRLPSKEQIYETITYFLNNSEGRALERILIQSERFAKDEALRKAVIEDVIRESATKEFKDMADVVSRVKGIQEGDTEEALWKPVIEFMLEGWRERYTPEFVVPASNSAQEATETRHLDRAGKETLVALLNMAGRERLMGMLKGFKGLESDEEARAAVADEIIAKRRFSSFEDLTERIILLAEHEPETYYPSEEYLENYMGDRSIEESEAIKKLILTIFNMSGSKDLLMMFLVGAKKLKDDETERSRVADEIIAEKPFSDLDDIVARIESLTEEDLKTFNPTREFK
ncbi:hypothetical protein ACFL5E_00850, partial [Candidatus Omnitrophota bacterium]